MEPAAPSLDIAALLAGGMGAELHWFPEDVPAQRLAAVLVGMANTSGGTVLIGVSPRAANILGIKTPAETLERLYQAALLSEPPLVLPMPRLQSVGNQQVLCLSVPAGLPHVYSLDGRYLGREGSQTNPLPARRLRQLLLERGVLQFESQVAPDATWEDLDMDKAAAYLRVLGLPFTSNTDIVEALLRRGCLKRVEGQVLPDYAALLLFGHHPQQWLPNAMILATHFPGVAIAAGADSIARQEIIGTLPEQIGQAEAFVRANLRTLTRLVGLSRQETSEYPLEAVGELLVNAVAHRDYGVQGDAIHLNIFADRIEIHSPGGLPGPVKLDNLLEARFSRNAVIVQVLSDLGFIERLGYGLNRVTMLMRQNNLRPPRFEETAGTFRATLFGPLEATPPASQPDISLYQNLDLNPRQQTALSFLIRHRRITSRDYQDLCPDVHPETLRRDLVDLVARNLLIKIGDKRSTYYILK